MIIFLFYNQFYNQVFEEYFQNILNEKKLNINHFLHHSNSKIQQLCISFVSKKHEISKKWEDIHQIFTRDETKNLEVTIEKSVLKPKTKLFIKNEIKKINQLISNEGDPQIKIMKKLASSNKAFGFN